MVWESKCRPDALLAKTMLLRMARGSVSFLGDVVMAVVRYLSGATSGPLISWVHTQIDCQTFRWGVGTRLIWALNHLNRHANYDGEWAASGVSGSDSLVIRACLFASLPPRPASEMSTCNPSNAEATFRQSTTTQWFFVNHLNPVILVFIKQLSLSTLRWVPIRQGFIYLSSFLHHFVVAK